MVLNRTTWQSRGISPSGLSTLEKHENNTFHLSTDAMDIDYVNQSAMGIIKNSQKASPR